MILWLFYERAMGVTVRLECMENPEIRNSQPEMKMGSVEYAECRKCGVWKTRSVENAECGKCGVWKMRSVENAERGKCGV